MFTLYPGKNLKWGFHIGFKTIFGKIYILKISGFTIIKNAVSNDYPIVEAIKSILPLVDEMIVLIGDCNDDTEGLIKSINSSKIKIHHSVWDKSLQKGGAVLADETNKAFKLIDPASTWAIYVQGDEVFHENDYETILKACKKYENNNNVQGFLMNYVHFYGTYKYIGDSRRWYNKEIRIVRNIPEIKSYKDAQGFRLHNQKLNVVPVNAAVYHYGWVKSPKNMMAKLQESKTYWQEDKNSRQNQFTAADVFNFNEFDSLTEFKGIHPGVMHERIERQNWQLDIDTSRKNFEFKDRILYWIEKWTGKRLFAYRNYKIIKA